MKRTEVWAGLLLLFICLLMQGCASSTMSGAAYERAVERQHQEDFNKRLNWR